MRLLLESRFQRATSNGAVTVGRSRPNEIFAFPRSPLPGPPLIGQFALPHRAALRVLLVEDNPDDAFLVRTTFRRHLATYDLRCVDSLARAVAVLGQAEADVVLLDLHLPDADGLDTLQQLRHSAPDLAIVILSGLDDERVALEAVRCGAQDYVVKGRIDQGTLARVLHYAVERHRSARMEHQQSEWFRTLVEHGRDATVVLARDGTVRYSCPVTPRSLGLSPDELVEQQFRELLHPDSGPVFERQFLASVEQPGTPFPGVLQIAHRDGSWRMVEGVFLNLLDNLNVRGIVFSYRDVTDRRRSDRALSGPANRLRALMDNAIDGIAVFNPAGVVVEANRRMIDILGRPTEQIMGCAVAELLGRPIEDLWPREAFAFIGSDRAEVVPGSGKQVVGIELLRPDNTTVIVDFSFGPVNVGGEWLVLAIGRDVTQHRQLERQFRQAQKLDAVGQLAGGVAHDFNNILTTILGHAELLLLSLGVDDARREDVQEIREAANRAAGLTQQLLAFSRNQVMQPRVLQLNTIIRNLEKMLARLIGEDISMATALAQDLGNVLADVGQLEQVIMNLVVNARDAMPTGGNLTVETSNCARIGDHPAPGELSGNNRDHVMLLVRDSGVGMNPTVLSRLFEPFFTTKETGRGTGLGLATVYGIVEQSGGEVTVESEVGLGTTFRIYLPRVDSPVDAPPQVIDADQPISGSETILVAEDNPQLRRLTTGFLGKLGFRVLEASSSEEALVIARRHKGVIHLLVTDVVMPGESGCRLSQVMVRERPGIRTLFVSGYTDDAMDRHGLQERGIHFLEKPFTQLTLARRVRALLDEH